MIRRTANALRHMTAAMLLIAVAAGAAEFSLRRASPEATPHITSTTCDSLQCWLVASDTTHHELRPRPESTAAAQPSGFSNDFRVNSLGCRGAEISTAATGIYRILVLGDDTICSPWTAEKETLPQRLAQFMQPQTSARLEVINGAVPGDCPLLSWLRFRHRLRELKPDLVILHFDMSDVADDASYRRLLEVEGSHAACPHPTLLTQPSTVGTTLSVAQQSALASWAVESTRKLLRGAVSEGPVDVTTEPFAWIADDPRDLRIQITHALRPLSALRDDVESQGGRLLVTTTPVVWQIPDAKPNDELTARYHITGVPPYRTRLPFKVIQRYCELEQIRFVDLVEPFESAGDRPILFSKTQPVLSAQGLALYAREISRYLITHPPVHWTPVTRQDQNTSSI